MGSGKYSDYRLSNYEIIKDKFEDDLRKNNQIDQADTSLNYITEVISTAIATDGPKSHFEKAILKVSSDTETPRRDIPIEDTVDQFRKLMNKARKKPPSGTFLHEFDQQDAIYKAENSPEDMKRLNSIIGQYNGLCDLICNDLTEKDGLNSESKLSSPQRVKRDKLVFNYAKTIELKQLENRTSHTHLLRASSIISKIFAAIFKSYPDSILTAKENRNLISTQKDTIVLNKTTLDKKFSKVSDGDYVKFAVFKKSGLLNFDAGHSMLIKKVNDNQYIFFDPNHGATKSLTHEELYKQLNKSMNKYKNEMEVNECAFMNNTSYMGRIKRKLNLGPFTKSQDSKPTPKIETQGLEAEQPKKPNCSK